MAEGARQDNARRPLAAIRPMLEEAGMVALVEPLGFPLTSSISDKAETLALIDEVGGGAVFRLVHDTFHHFLAGGGELFPERTGIVHVSGVVDRSLALEEIDDETSPAIIRRFYDAGIYPDWWKLEPFKSDAAWAKACADIVRHDPNTRGVVVLGLDAPAHELRASFARAARHDLVRGFAVGRTIFGDAARGWMTGEIDDEAAIADMANRFASLAETWDRARAEGRDEAA